MPLSEGLLFKQGSGRGLFETKNWRLRWCVVDYGSIKFYNSSSESNELRNYSLAGATVTSHADAASYNAVYEWVFIIHFSPEAQKLGSPAEVVLSVQYPEEMQDWVIAIKEADGFHAGAQKITIDEPAFWLSIEEIKNLAAMLTFDSFSPIFAFAQTITPSQSGPFVDNTLSFLLHSSDLSHFVDVCVNRAISGQVLSTLFRENGVFLRFIVGYMFLTGQDFLKKVVEPHIARIIEYSSLEIDPLRIPVQDPQTLSAADIQMIQQTHCKSNQVKIMTITNALLSSISSAELPAPISKVLHRISVVVNRDFPEFLYSGVVNVFFLRFIVASIFSPQNFGLCKDVKPSASQSRNLSLIAKVVQNIANGIVDNKKEPYMQPLASFVMEQQPVMMSFYLKVSQSAPPVLPDEAAGSSPSRFASGLSKKDSQDLQSSSNWWIRLIDANNLDLPQEMQQFISQSDFGRAPMRDSFRGQLASWSSILDGKLVTRPFLFSTLKPTMFMGDAFLIASFNCWCKLNRAMMHGTLYVTRSAFIFIASVFGSFDEVVVMRYSNVERITKLNIGDVDSLFQLDMNRPFFLGMQNAIRLDFTTDSGVSATAILFWITVDSNVEVPVDGCVDPSGKKSPSIFAAMYHLLSLTKNRQEAEMSEEVQPPSREAPKRSSLTAGTPAVRSSSSFQQKRPSTSSPVLQQLQLLQEPAKISPDDSRTTGRGKRHSSRSVHEAATGLLRHINANKNCYETNFASTRFLTRDPPIMTYADWDTLSPFICVMVFNAGEYAEFPDPAMRYLLCVNNGSFAFCSGSRKNIEFFLTRGNNLIYENHTAQNFAQLYACEPRSSLVFLQVPLESIPNAPDGFEHRLINFVLSIASSSFRDSKRVERSLTMALQLRGSIKGSPVPTESTLLTTDTAIDSSLSVDSFRKASIPRRSEIMLSNRRSTMQAALEIHESQFQSVHAPPRQPEIAADDYDEDSD